MTRKEFAKRLKKINPNLCIIVDGRLKTAKILLADDIGKMAKTVLDLTKGIWYEGNNYLSLTEHNKLRDLLRDSSAFLKSRHLFDKSDLKASMPDYHFKDYTDNPTETLKEKDGKDLVFYGEDDDPKDLDQWNAILPPLPEKKPQLKEQVNYLKDKNKALENKNAKLAGELSAYRQILKTLLDILSKEHKDEGYNL